MGRRWQKDASSDVKFFLNAEALDYKLVGQGGAAEPSGPQHFDESEFGGDDDDSDIPF